MQTQLKDVNKDPFHDYFISRLIRYLAERNAFRIAIAFNKVSVTAAYSDIDVILNYSP